MVEFAMDQPAYGQLRVSNELKREGVLISPGGVRSVWSHHDLESRRKRLKALERAKEEKVAHGERDPPPMLSGPTGHLLCVQHQRCGQDPCTDLHRQLLQGGSHVKLYDRKNALVAADPLNERMVPFYDRHGVPLMRILTDRGTEYCGNREHHEYQLYLAIEDMDHTRAKARAMASVSVPMGPLQEEFLWTAFRKRIHRAIEELQADLNAWLEYYNPKGHILVDIAMARPLCGPSTTASPWPRGDRWTMEGPSHRGRPTGVKGLSLTNGEKGHLDNRRIELNLEQNLNDSI